MNLRRLILLLTALLLLAPACNNSTADPGDEPTGEEQGQAGEESEEAEEGEEDDETDESDDEIAANEAPEPEETAQAEQVPANDDPTVAPADVAAAPADARVTSTGLAVRVLRPGHGSDHPTATQTVSVHYTGWTTDGEMFDSSVQRGEPASFPLNRVIAGWTEGLQLMVEGEKSRLWIPEELAYRGMPGRPAGMLVFDVELLEIVRPAGAPDDVAAPPADAEVTASGLASKVLQPGTGTTHPSPTDTVTVHYSGWTTDGEMFDSSVQRGQPASFPLNRVIAGWTEGLQLMVEGEKRRFWIPVDLAYGNRPGRPAGMLVFDVELLGIQAP